jgi:hypothetical protein
MPTPTGYTRSPKLQPGALIQLTRGIVGIVPSITLFQYNPEQIQRSFEIHADVGANEKGLQAPVNQPYPPDESLSFTLELDATDDLERGRTLTETYGIADRLAVLERLIFPSTGPLGEPSNGNAQADSEPVARRPTVPIVLLALGRRRVNKLWNSLAAYAFDPEQTLAPGTTELWLDNTIGVVPADWQNKWVLLHSEPEDLTKPRRRHLVYIINAVAESDLLADPPVTLLHITWDAAQALPWCVDFDGLAVHGNMIHATAGERRTALFQIHGSDPAAIQAVEREGPRDSSTGERSVTFLCSLPDAETAGLGWLGDDLRNTRPEMSLDHDYLWRRTLLDSTDLDAHYTLEDGTWRRVIGFQRATLDQDHVHFDYASGEGKSGARISVVYDPEAAGNVDLCTPIALQGFSGAENETIRVQLIGEQRFLWGLDNASPLYRVTVEVTEVAITVTFTTKPRDAAHQPRIGQVERAAGHRGDHPRQPLRVRP